MHIEIHKCNLFKGLSVHMHFHEGFINMFTSEVCQNKGDNSLSGYLNTPSVAPYGACVGGCKCNWANNVQNQQ
jgi:hypothetical protein